MHAIKIVAKYSFLGAFVLGFAGLLVGGVAAVFIWPESNLGPPVGAIYGLGIGILAGAVLGGAFGVVRIIQSRPETERESKNGGAAH